MTMMALKAQICLVFVLGLAGYVTSTGKSGGDVVFNNEMLEEAVRRVMEQMYSSKANNTDELEERIELLESSVAVIEEDVDNLESQDILISARLLDIETDVFNNENAIEDLSDRFDGSDVLLLNHTMEIEHLFASVNDLDLRVDALQDADVRIQSRLDHLEESVNAPWTACESSPCDNGASCVDVNVDTFICICRDGYFGITCSESYQNTIFLATITGWDVTPVNNPIIFNETRMDYGENYNSSTGIYTVPISGLYEFHVQIYRPDGEDQVTWAVFIIVDGVYITDSAHPANPNGQDDDTSLNISVMINLSAGQQVYVNHLALPHIRGTHDDGRICSWFSGRLILPA